MRPGYSKSEKMDPWVSKSEGKGTKSEPRDTKSEPKGSQREPKVSQREPKVSQREPKVSQREPKGSQKWAKGRPPTPSALGTSPPEPRFKPNGQAKVCTFGLNEAWGSLRCAWLLALYVQGLALYVQEALCTFRILSARSGVALYV